MKVLPFLAVALIATPAFADDVNVPAKPLPNETATTTPVALSCLVQSDASLSDCQLADGERVSKKNTDEAIGMINGKMHVTGAFAAGSRKTVTVLLHGGGTPLLPIR